MKIITKSTAVLFLLTALVAGNTYANGQSMILAENSSGKVKFEQITLKKGTVSSAKAQQYQRLAQQHKPRTVGEERLAKQYMALPAHQRNNFKASHPDVSKSIWDYTPYAICFYASVAGGADVVEAGDECHENWVD